MSEYNCRIDNDYGLGSWEKIKAGDPALAAQIFSEDISNGVDDGTVIEVDGHGKYLANFRIVITKAI